MKGYTLIELMIVIVLGISVFGALLIVGLGAYLATVLFNYA